MKSLALLACGLLSFIVVSTVSADVSESPGYAEITSWDPFAWKNQEGAIAQTVRKGIINNTTGAKNQGYVANPAFLLEDTSLSDTPGTCIRELWDTLPVGTGILEVTAHGQTGSILAVAFSTKAAAKQWMEAGTGPANMKLYHFTRPTTDAWTVEVSSQWFITNWQAQSNASKLIAFITGCEGAATSTKNPTSVVTAVGGRVGFSPNHVIQFAFAAGKAIQILKNMNGTVPTTAPGSARSAAAAYSNADPMGSDLTMVGNGATTLCPAVAYPYQGNVSPTGVTSNSNYGTGQIVFDTHLRTTGVDPSAALTWRVTSGTVTLSNFQWTNDYTITFIYTANEGGSFGVEMTAHANLIVPSNHGGQQLDGGGLTSGGVAPNMVDFVWYFSADSSN